MIRTILLNLFAFLLVPSGVVGQVEAQGAKPAPAPAAASAPAKLDLTPLQSAQLDAIRQRFFRVQDVANSVLQEFSKKCLDAQKENAWPDVVCSVQDLSVQLKTPPPPPPSIPSIQTPVPAAAPDPGNKPAAKENPPSK